MARISAVGLYHARTLAKLLVQETLAARGHTGNNYDTQKTVAARYIFDRSKKKRHNFEFRSRHGYKSDFFLSRLESY